MMILLPSLLTVDALHVGHFTLGTRSTAGGGIPEREVVEEGGGRGGRW